MTKRIAAAAMFVLLMSHVCCATTVQRLDLEDLVKKARTIVAGTVAGSRTYWTADRKLILTSYTIQVDESIKGQPGRSIEVTALGGKVGAIEMQVSGMPSFEKGESTVVFIEQSGAYQTVVGLGQGKFTVVNGEVANSVSGLVFPDGKAGRTMRMPVQAFKNQIRTILSR